MIHLHWSNTAMNGASRESLWLMHFQLQLFLNILPSRRSKRVFWCWIWSRIQAIWRAKSSCMVLVSLLGGIWYNSSSRIATLIFRATYGYYLESAEDRMLQVSQSNMKNFGYSSTPGNFLVDVFPMCTWPVIIVLKTSLWCGWQWNTCHHGFPVPGSRNMLLNVVRLVSQPSGNPIYGRRKHWLVFSIIQPSTCPIKLTGKWRSSSTQFIQHNLIWGSQ